MTYPVQVRAKMKKPHNSTSYEVYFLFKVFTCKPL